MRGLESANASAKAAALLLLVIGTVGGALGGGAVGVRLGRRSPARPPAEALRPPAVAERREPLKLQNTPSIPDAGTAPLDGGSNVHTLRLCVEVRDAGDRVVGGALISAKPVIASQLAKLPQADDPIIGELGVFSGPLPFPQDIIDGRYVPLGLNRPAPAGGEGGLRSDDKGRACLQLQGPGRIQITATTPERTATQEISLPAEIKSSTPAVDLILRLAEPLDALCRLMTPASAVSEADFGEPISDAVGPEVSGRVVDGRGFGVTAARIEGTVGRSRIVGVSDGAGGFKLVGLPRGTLSLRVQLAGYVPLLISRRADEPRSDLQLTLRPGGGIAGIVRDGRRGSLPPGTQLTLIAGADGVATAIPLSADGSFTATGLPVGAATLRARAAGYAPLSRTLQIPGSEAPAQVTLRDLRLDLEAGASLIGQVRGPTGAAMGATVEALDRNGLALGKTLTDDHGDFTLNDLPAGRLRITAASSQGRGETSVELRADAQERVYFEIH